MPKRFISRVFNFLAVTFAVLVFSCNSFAAVVYGGSFSVKQNAKKLQSRIVNMGYKAIIKVQRINGESLNVVLIKDVSNSKAVDICDRLEYNKIKCYVNLDGAVAKKRPTTKYKPKVRKFSKPNNEYRRSTQKGNANTKYIGNQNNQNPDYRQNNQTKPYPAGSEFNL